MSRVTFNAILSVALSLLLITTTSTAQSVAPANWTSSNSDEPGDSNVRLVLHAGATQHVYAYDLVASTPTAVENIPNDGLQGSLLVLSPSGSLTLNSSDVALLQCDPTDSFLQPSDLLASALASHPVAVVLWSSTSDYCTLGQGSIVYPSIYTMTSSNSSYSMMTEIELLSSGDTKTIGAAIGLVNAGVLGNGTSAGNSTVGGSNNNGTTGAGSQEPPTPGTAVAMVILYAVTGIITLLFLSVIVTGAVRAHRHPERYGPRNTAGRPRQSRARGLARAMLESLPIVKVGDPAGDKPEDVELAAGRHGPVEELAVSDPTTSTPAATDAAHTDPASPPATTTDPAATTSAPTESDPDVIAASVPAAAPPAEDHLGCSICTEDFQVGEDQRVLPCDHRFHPACIDPWLLNVSGTCPLCRIDLRHPHGRRGSAVSGETDGGVVADGVVDAVPPLDGNGAEAVAGNRRVSFYRALVLSLGGATRPPPGTMTREERLTALRELRGQQLAGRSRRDSSAVVEGEGGESVVGRGTEGERSRRQRLRDVFRVRTRRTGEEVREENEVPQGDVGEAVHEERTGEQDT